MICNIYARSGIMGIDDTGGKLTTTKLFGVLVPVGYATSIRARAKLRLTHLTPDDLTDKVDLGFISI